MIHLATCFHDSWLLAGYFHDSWLLAFTWLLASMIPSMIPLAPVEEQEGKGQLSIQQPGPRM